MRHTAVGMCFALTLVACGSKSPTTPSPTPTRIISLSGNIDVGNIPINQSSTATLSIRNNGNAPLTVTGVTWSQAPTDPEAPPVITNLGWRSGTIQPGDLQDVVVQFTPAQPGSFNGAITVQGNQTSGVSGIAFTGAGR